MNKTKCFLGQAAPEPEPDRIAGYRDSGAKTIFIQILLVFAAAAAAATAKLNKKKWFLEGGQAWNEGQINEWLQSQVASREPKSSSVMIIPVRF